MYLLIMVAVLAALTWLVATLLPKKHAGSWLLGLIIIAAWIAPNPYGDALLWLGFVLVMPLWVTLSDRKGKEPIAHGHSD